MAVAETENLFYNEQYLLNLLSYLIIGSGVAAYVTLYTIPAPYGRYYDGSWKWGYKIDGKVGWILQELPSLLIPVILTLSWQNTPKASPNCVLLFFFMLHYFQRSIVFPCLIRGGKPSPFVTVLLAFIFCSSNGYLQARTLTNYAQYPVDYIYSTKFITGSCMFLVGMLINLHSDHILRNLRQPGETGYKIPRGGMFEYVSGANFFGEIVEWLGFAIACWTLPALAFFIFTFCVLIPRGYTHHQNYLKKFQEYPPNRKAVIPFIL